MKVSEHIDYLRANVPELLWTDQVRFAIWCVMPFFQDGPLMDFLNKESSSNQFYVVFNALREVWVDPDQSEVLVEAIGPVLDIDWEPDDLSEALEDVSQGGMDFLSGLAGLQKGIENRDSTQFVGVAESIINRIDYKADFAELAEKPDRRAISDEMRRQADFVRSLPHADRELALRMREIDWL